MLLGRESMTLVLRDGARRSAVEFAFDGAKPVEPRGENQLFLAVNNPEATSGGSRTEFPRIRQDDVDAAVADLNERLGAAWTDRLDDPDLGGGVATVFPDTADLGDPTFTTELDGLVGKEQESFELGGFFWGKFVFAAAMSQAGELLDFFGGIHERCPPSDNVRVPHSKSSVRTRASDS